MSGYQLVYITTSSEEEAELIGRSLVERRLAACVNILHPMRSLYWWDGEIEEGRETVLIAKTVSGNVSALTGEVNRLHSYECPCVAVLDIRPDVGNGEYLKWIANQAVPL